MTEVGEKIVSDLLCAFPAIYHNHGKPGSNSASLHFAKLLEVHRKIFLRRSLCKI